MTTKHDRYFPGLEGVIAAETRLSSVDGQRGELLIGGYPLALLAAEARFPEVVYLLWHGSLPTRAQLQDFEQALATHRDPPPETLSLLETVAAAETPVMDALRLGLDSLSVRDFTADNGAAGGQETAIAILAAAPTVAAAYWRLQQGLEPIPPDPALGHAANYLYMLTGARPSPVRARALEVYFLTVMDHGLNASTFTARVIVSTRSDLVSAVLGALGALKGPLHGGAPGPALDMVFEIGQPERAAAYLREKLDRGERLMGFGHRVYKVRDPRAEVLAAAAEALFTADGDMALYRLARHVEATAVDLLEAYKPGRNLQTNVEFYTALLLHGLELPVALFTPTFALSRMAGWLAHCFEQQQTGRLIRPKAVFTGVREKAWVPVSDRG